MYQEVKVLRIETDIPFPAARTERGTIYPFAQLEAPKGDKWDSFFVELDESNKKIQNRAGSMVSYYNKKHRAEGKKFSYRLSHVIDNGKRVRGFRVWRIA